MMIGDQDLHPSRLASSMPHGGDAVVHGNQQVGLVFRRQPGDFRRQAG